MSSWVPDSPVRLRNGHLVCKSHHLRICHICCVDYTFDDGYEDSSSDDYDEYIDTAYSDDEFESSISPRHARVEHTNQVSSGRYQDREQNSRRSPTPPSFFFDDPEEAPYLQYRDDGTLIVPYIGTFVPSPPEASPMSLFPCTDTARNFSQFVNRANNQEVLIYTDGACLNNGQSNPAAGWSFIYHDPLCHPETPAEFGRLENHGPSGEPHPQTSNRAELRAVIAAIQYRYIRGEKDLARIVIATDSEYVVKGVTEWIHRWGRNGWRTSQGAAVKNRDLWEELLREVMKHRQNGSEISFWRIPRGWNTEADSAAKAAARGESVQHFEPRYGTLCDKCRERLGW